MTLAALFHVVLLGISVLSTCALAVYAWRSRHVHGARAFQWLLIAFAIYAGSHLIGLLTPAPHLRGGWEVVQWTATASIPVFWILFAAAYTGNDDIVDRRFLVALSIIPALTVVLTWTNPWHGLMWIDNTLVIVDGLAIYEQTFGPWFWIFTAYTYGSILAGGFLLLRLVWYSDHLYADQAVLLVVGVFVPIVASALSVVQILPGSGPLVDITPYSFVVSGCAFGYALYRHRLFDLVPATRKIGRNAVTHTLTDGVVIVDTDQQVLYLNPAASAVLSCTSEAALGQSLQSLLGPSTVDFETDDALAEFERDGRSYTVRTSPITDRHDTVTGYTLIVQDVTTRKERERRLEAQQERLERLDDLNAAIRGVHRALVTASTQAAIRQTVCEHLVDGGVFETACAAEASLLTGAVADWTIVGTESVRPSIAETVLEDIQAQGVQAPGARVLDHEDESGEWTVVPLVYGPTVYGVLAVCTGDENAWIIDRERTVLAELGELIGHACNAVETRRLLSAEAVVELEFTSEDEDGTLREVGMETGAAIELRGLVPDAVDGHLAYLRTSGGAVDTVADALAERRSSRVRVVRSEEDAGLIEWAVADETLLATLVDEGCHVRSFSVADSITTAVVEVASTADIRPLVGRISAAFPATRLAKKRPQERPAVRNRRVSPARMADLTDRQQEVVATAYQAGYFDWPRGSSAEEIAETLDITAPTLHAHLRKAQGTLLGDLFQRDERTAE